MTSTIVYATSTVTARRHRTGLAGINRVASAPTWWCSEGCPGKGHDHECPEPVLTFLLGTP